MLIKYLVLRICFYYFVISIAKAWRPFRIEFTNISSKSYVNSVEINSSISANGAISIYVNVLQDISNFYIKALILLQSTSSENYDLELINKTLNACEFFRNKKYEPILQVFYKILTKTGTFPKSCPVRKRLYFVQDVHIDAEDLPPVFPSKKGFAEITLSSKNGNKQKPLFGFTLHVESNQLDKMKK